MKVNDTVPVTIAGQTVANATVRELGDGTATLVVPATLVVMATRTELTVETPQVDPTAAETIITGVDRTSGEPTGELDPQPVGQVESAAVGETQTVDNSSTVAEVSPAPSTQAPVAVAEGAVVSSETVVENPATQDSPTNTAAPEPQTKPGGSNGE